MNPSSTPAERKRLYKKFFNWHLSILKRHEKIDGINPSGTKSNKLIHLEFFPGFKPSMEGCMVDWNDWDDKKGTLMLVPQDNDAEKGKSKNLKKKKKKSKSSKLMTSELKTTTENDTETQVDQENVNAGTSSSSRLGENEDLLTSKSTSHADTQVSHQIHLPEPAQNVLQEVQVAGNHHVAEPADPEVELDLQVYFMDKQPESALKSDSIEDLIKINMRRLNDPLEILFAKAEGLHAHGHFDEARKLAVKAANEILNHPNYPNLKPSYSLQRRRRKRGGLDNQMSIAASEALTKIAFLCNVLLEDLENHNLVFKLILFGVEVKRSPAATKPLEVKLINQKHDLITLLKCIILHEDEMTVLREKAQAFQDNIYENYSDALTTLILGNYLFEALVLSKPPGSTSANRSAIDNNRSSTSNSFAQPGQFQLEEHYLIGNDLNQQSNFHQTEQIRQTSQVALGKLANDSNLGFQAALNAVSVKLTISETDHPLLCEGARRQKGELVLSMLNHFKDDQEKLDLILKHLFDKDLAINPSKTTSSPEKQSKKTSSLDPNQPTEASAHFMYELAKSVFDKAGGNSMTAHLFRPQVITQNGPRGIHRRLHMCSLRIALYSLGLQNRTSSNWLHRTYNGRASFILDQALEIGLPAIKFLSDNWIGHLTPVEAAGIADKAGCSNDQETKRVAADMAKSTLKFANHLDVNTVRRILAQCREQSVEMIEEACSDIERVAEDECVCADVLFAAARAWSILAIKPDLHGDSGCCLYKDSMNADNDNGASDWLDTSGQQLDKCQHFTDSVRPTHWDVYGRVDFISNMYSSTYKHVEYVKAAYRVGIKALDAMKPSLYMTSKHNPKKEDDVLWLLELSKQLGREYLHNFSLSAIKNITNPQVLHHISSDLTKLFETLPEDHVGRVNILLPLIHKCLDRYVKQMRDLIKHGSYEQKTLVESILDLTQDLTATAYTPTAVNHFNDLLKVIDSRKRAKSRLYVETRERYLWVKKLSSEMANCTCNLCRTSGPVSSY